MGKGDVYAKDRVGVLIKILNSDDGPPVEASEHFTAFLEGELARAFESGMLAKEAQMTTVIRDHTATA